MTAFIAIAYLKLFGSTRATIEADTREEAEAIYRARYAGRVEKILALEVLTEEEDATRRANLPKVSFLDDDAEERDE